MERQGGKGGDGSLRVNMLITQYIHVQKLKDQFIYKKYALFLELKFQLYYPLIMNNLDENK